MGSVGHDENWRLFREDPSGPAILGHFLGYDGGKCARVS